MGLLFAILLLGVPLAAAIYDLSKTGDGVGNFKFAELIGRAGPTAEPAKIIKPAPALSPVKSETPVAPYADEPPAT